MRIRIELAGHLAESLPVKLPEDSALEMIEGSLVEDALQAIGVSALPLLILVNGQRVRMGQPLRDGDLIELVPIIGGG